MPVMYLHTIHTLEVPFNQRINIYVCITLKRDSPHISRSNVPIVNTEVSRHCHHCLKFTQMQQYIAGIYISFIRLSLISYPFSYPLHFGRLMYVCTLLLLSLEAHFVSLGSINLALPIQRLTRATRQAILRANFVHARGTCNCTHGTCKCLVSYY